MARGRVTAAYDSWLSVPFCLVLLVVGPSTALSQCYITALEIVLCLFQVNWQCHFLCLVLSSVQE